MLENLIDWQARQCPDRPALQTDEGVVTYGRLARDVAVMTMALARETLPPGIVLIGPVPIAMHWLLTLALERLGHPTVSDPNRPAETAKLVGPGAVITADEYGQDLGGARHLRVDAAWRTAAFSLEPSPRRAPARPDDLVRVVLSSGTTGARKQVPITRGVMDARLGAPVIGAEPMSLRALQTLGSDTMLGFQQPLTTWLHGGVALLLKTLTQAAFRAHRPTWMVMSPAQLRLCLPSMKATASAARPLFVRVSGSAAPPILIKDALSEPGLELITSYGSTEAGTVASGPTVLALDRPGAVGYVTPWVQVEIVDDQGRVLPTAESGVVRIRGAGVSSGYVGSDPFQDGWFYPNDIGHIDPDGVLVIDGRRDDVINIGGVKLSTTRVEETLLACEGVQDAAVAVLPMTSGRWAMFAAIVSSGDHDPETLRTAVLGKYLVDCDVVQLDEIPRSSAGKIVHEALKQAILDRRRIR